MISAEHSASHVACQDAVASAGPLLSLAGAAGVLGTGKVMGGRDGRPNPFGFSKNLQENHDISWSIMVFPCSISHSIGWVQPIFRHTWNLLSESLHCFSGWFPTG